MRAAFAGAVYIVIESDLRSLSTCNILCKHIDDNICFFRLTLHDVSVTDEDGRRKFILPNKDKVYV